MAERISKPLLYYDDLNPHSRCVLMLLKLLNVDVELRYVNLLAGEHLKPGFTHINPAHTVPVMVHHTVTITDSHAILMYICDNFAGDYSRQLLPNNCYKKRLRIYNKLFFEASVLHRRHGQLMTDLVRKTMENTEITFHERRVKSAYDAMESFLHHGPFMAGNQLTIADFAMVATVGALDMMFPIGEDRTRWRNLYDWHKRMKAMPVHKVNFNGIEKQREVVEMYGRFEFPSTLRRRSTAAVRQSRVPRLTRTGTEDCEDDESDSGSKPKTTTDTTDSDEQTNSSQEPKPRESGGEVGGTVNDQESHETYMDLSPIESPQNENFQDEPNHDCQSQAHMANVAKKVSQAMSSTANVANQAQTSIEDNHLKTAQAYTTKPKVVTINVANSGENARSQKSCLSFHGSSLRKMNSVYIMDAGEVQKPNVAKRPESVEAQLSHVASIMKGRDAQMPKVALPLKERDAQVLSDSSQTLKSTSSQRHETRTQTTNVAGQIAAKDVETPTVSSQIAATKIKTSNVARQTEASTSNAARQTEATKSQKPHVADPAEATGIQMSNDSSHMQAKMPKVASHIEALVPKVACQIQAIEAQMPNVVNQIQAVEAQMPNMAITSQTTRAESKTPSFDNHTQAAKSKNINVVYRAQTAKFKTANYANLLHAMKSQMLNVANHGHATKTQTSNVANHTHPCKTQMLNVANHGHATKTQTSNVANHTHLHKTQVTSVATHAHAAKSYMSNVANHVQLLKTQLPNVANHIQALKTPMLNVANHAHAAKTHTSNVANHQCQIRNASCDRTSKLPVAKAGNHTKGTKSQKRTTVNSVVTYNSSELPEAQNQTYWAEDHCQRRHTSPVNLAVTRACPLEDTLGSQVADAPNCTYRGNEEEVTAVLSDESMNRMRPTMSTTAEIIQAFEKNITTTSNAATNNKKGKKPRPETRSKVKTAKL